MRTPDRSPERGIDDCFRPHPGEVEHDDRRNTRQHCLLHQSERLPARRGFAQDHRLTVPKIQGEHDAVAAVRLDDRGQSGERSKRFQSYDDAMRSGSKGGSRLLHRGCATIYEQPAAGMSHPAQKILLRRTAQDRIQISYVALFIAECLAVRSSQRHRISGFAKQHGLHRGVRGPDAPARPDGTTRHEVQHRNYPHR